MYKKIHKMMILVFIICAVNLVFDGFLLFENHQAKSKYETVLFEYIPHEEDFFHLSKDMYKMQSLALAEIVTEDQERSQEYLEQIDKMDQSIQKTLTSYSSFSHDRDEAKLLQKLYSTFLQTEKNAGLL